MAASKQLKNTLRGFKTSAIKQDLDVPVLCSKSYKELHATMCASLAGRVPDRPSVIKREVRRTLAALSDRQHSELFMPNGITNRNGYRPLPDHSRHRANPLRKGYTAK